jgi:ABC-2 type transport system permease protein
VRSLAPLWPAYHLGQLALGAAGQPADGTPLAHVAALAGVTIAFLYFARRRLSLRA